MNEKQPTPDSGTELTHDLTDDETPSEAVISAVAAVSNTDPANMEPLAEYVDPDALDALFADQYDGTIRSGGIAQFSFSGYTVVLDGGGQISVLKPVR